MYGLKNDLNLEPLIGRKLEQLCLGLYDVQLRFEKSFVFVLQCKMTLTTNVESTLINYDQPAQSSTLAQLIGKSVERYLVISSEKLELAFSDDSKLILHDSSKEYESYVIWVGGTPLIV